MRYSRISGFLLALCSSFSCFLTAPAQAALPLLPAPQSVELTGGALDLRGAFDVVRHGCDSAMLDRAVQRFQDDVGRLSGIDLQRAAGPRLDLYCGADDPAWLTDHDNETYRLVVGADGVRLEAAGPAGVLRGLATLRQLIRYSAHGVSLPLLSVVDAPRFAWRGVMIDVARHFMPVPALKRQIDAMELVKLNVLHLHLSDNEAFRVQSLRYPELQKASVDGLYYSQAQIRELVAYAADRGVRVVPEFDMPGHTGAIVAAYPELGAGRFDRRDPRSVLNVALDPARDETWRFIDGLLGEMSALFPDRYLHVGGDELGPAAWTPHADIEAFAQSRQLAGPKAVEAWFQGRVRTILRRYGKAAIGWDEVADLPDYGDTVIQSWRTSNVVSKVTAAGGKVIVSSGYYLDFRLPAADYYRVEPTDPNAFGISVKEADAARALSPRVAHVVDGFVVEPMPPLTPAQQKHVLGGEAALWSEQVSGEMLDTRLWPATAAIAERFWSPAAPAAALDAVDALDASGLYPRLFAVQDELRLLGLQDRNNRERMASRLAPGEADPVTTLLDVVRPVQYIAHDHGKRAALHGQPPGPPEALTGLADAAAADSALAQRFLADVRDFVAGDGAKAGVLKAQLRIWQANDARFADVARGRPELEAALPVSADVAEMAQCGLAAIEALERREMLSADFATRAKTVLGRASAAALASSTYLRSAMQPQPPADLIIAIAPGIEALVEAASRTGAARS